MRKVFDSNEELRELEQKLKMAQVNKLRKAQLEEKQQLENDKLMDDFKNDQEYLDKLQAANQANEIENHKKRIQALENERDIRRQILIAEAESEAAHLEQKLKDKAQVDAIVSNILNANSKAKEAVEESKKKQFGNMVESL
jgi:hypothetical protein